MSRNLRYSFLLVAVMFNRTSSMACSCGPSIPVSVEFLLSNDLVFSGKVLDIKPITGKNGFHEYNMAIFLVDTWIAPAHYTDTVSVYTGVDGGSCGLDFREGDIWIIFSSRFYNELNISSICSPSLK